MHAVHAIDSQTQHKTYLLLHVKVRAYCSRSNAEPTARFCTLCHLLLLLYSGKNFHFRIKRRHNKAGVVLRMRMLCAIFPCAHFSDAQYNWQHFPSCGRARVYFPVYFHRASCVFRVDKSAVKFSANKNKSPMNAIRARRAFSFSLLTELDAIDIVAHN